MHIFHKRWILLKQVFQLLGLISFHLLWCSCDYNIHVEGLLPANLWSVILLILEQCLQFERFRLQHVQKVNKTSHFKTNLTGNNAEASRVNRNIAWCSLSHILHSRLPATSYCLARGAVFNLLQLHMLNNNKSWLKCKTFITVGSHN